MPTAPFRHRVTIQAVTLIFDDMGGWEETWADLATVWARVEALKGEEYFAAAQMQNSVSHRVTMRYRAPHPHPPPDLRGPHPRHRGGPA